MTSRVDSLLAELAARHKPGDAFIQSLRPMVVRILDDGTPAEQRPALLEMVAESCDRHVEIERNCAQAKAAWEGFTEQLKFLAQRAMRNNRDQGGNREAG